MRRERLARPQFDASDIKRINSDVTGILESGWLTTGRFVEKLERQVSRTTGTRHSVAVNSGTAALHTMMAWLHLRSDDEVVVPANTFASTANAVLYEGARPTLADCDPDTFNVTASTVGSKITRRTKAVIVTHIAGNPCEMQELVDLCDQKGLYLFEDAAHAIGSRYNGRSCGSLGKGAAFSMYPTKVITSAEGGVLTTQDPDLADFARLYRNVGRRSLGAGPIEILGHNYRMSDIHAAIGLSQIGHLPEFVASRNKLARQYGKELRTVTWLKPQSIARESRSSYYCYIVRVVPGKSPITRDELMARLSKKGIETTVMFRPINTQPYFEKYGECLCPNAEAVGRETLVLPLHTLMTERDVKRVVSAIREAGS